MAEWLIVIGTAHIVCGPGSMQQSSVRPSVHLPVYLRYHSTAAAACGRFAAELHADRRYRSTAAGARRPAANAGSAILTAELTRLDIDLYDSARCAVQEHAMSVDISSTTAQFL